MFFKIQSYCFPILFPSFLFADRRKGAPLPWSLEAKSLFCFGRSRIFNFRCPGIFFCLHLWSAVNTVRGFSEHKVYWKKILSHYDFIFCTNNLEASFQVFLLFSLLLFFLSDLFSVRKNHHHLRGSLTYGLFWHLASVCLGDENALVQLKI